LELLIAVALPTSRKCRGESYVVFVALSGGFEAENLGALMANGFKAHDLEQTPITDVDSGVGSASTTSVVMWL